MKEVKIKSRNNVFLLINTNGYNDTVNCNDLDESIVKSAIGASKTLFIHVGFGIYSHVEFTIQDINKDSEGNYVYTITSSVSMNKHHFPKPFNIVKDKDGLVAPISTCFL